MGSEKLAARCWLLASSYEHKVQSHPLLAPLDTGHHDRQIPPRHRASTTPRRGVPALWLRLPRLLPLLPLAPPLPFHARPQPPLHLCPPGPGPPRSPRHAPPLPRPLRQRHLPLSRPPLLPCPQTSRPPYPPYLPLHTHLGCRLLYRRRGLFPRYPPHRRAPLPQVPDLRHRHQPRSPLPRPGCHLPLLLPSTLRCQLCPCRRHPPPFRLPLPSPLSQPSP